MKVAATRPRGRPRAKDADEKTERILHEAAALFASRGYNKTSFASVADAVGMTLPGLTHYFPRKIDLLLAVLHDRDARVFEGGSPPNGTNFFEVLPSLMKRDVTVGADLTKLFAVLSAEALSTDHPAHEWFKARYARILGNVERGFHEMQEAGVIRAEVDCRAEATSALATMEGLQLWWLRVPEAADPVARFALHLDAVKARIMA